MPRLLPLLLLPLLAACDASTLPPLPGATPAEPPPPPTLPANVAAVLPPGTPVNTVFQNTDGCYLFSIERTDPPSGFPVRDAAGNQVCAPQAS